MPVEFYVYLLAGALAGGFNNGLAGFKWLSTAHFRRLIIIMMLISGTVLLIRGLVRLVGNNPSIQPAIAHVLR